VEKFYNHSQIVTDLTALKTSKFRSRFKSADKDRQYIQDKVIDTIRSHAVDFITTRSALGDGLPQK
jgi:hypothetical protein